MEVAIRYLSGTGCCGGGEEEGALSLGMLAAGALLVGAERLGREELGKEAAEACEVGLARRVGVLGRSSRGEPVMVLFLVLVADTGTNPRASLPVPFFQGSVRPIAKKWVSN